MPENLRREPRRRRNSNAVDERDIHEFYFSFTSDPQLNVLASHSRVSDCQVICPQHRQLLSPPCTLSSVSLVKATSVQNHRPERCALN